MRPALTRAVAAMRAMLAAGDLDDRKVEMTIEQKAVPMMLTGMGMEQVDLDLQGMFEKILPKQTSRRELSVGEARRLLFEQECEAMINQEKVNAAAIDLAASLAGTDMLQMQTWHVMFLARGKAGPFRADGEAVRGATGKVGVRLTLHDEGNGNRMVTSASAVFEVRA